MRRNPGRLSRRWSRSHNALAKRYGAPKDLADYVAKAQLDNYDNVRAQFEAFNAHSDAGEPVNRRDLLDAQQCVAFAALALVRLLPQSGRRVFRRQEGQRALHIQYSYDTLPSFWSTTH